MKTFKQFLGERIQSGDISNWYDEDQQTDGGDNYVREIYRSTKYRVEYWSHEDSVEAYVFWDGSVSYAYNVTDHDIYKNFKLLHTREHMDLTDEDAIEKFSYYFENERSIDDEHVHLFIRALDRPSPYSKMLPELR